MFIETVWPLRPDVARILQWFDNAVCVVFLADFALRFHEAPDKLRFLRWGWIDLVASIPNLDYLRWGRLVRLLRILRSIRSIKAIVSVLVRMHPRSGIGFVALLAALLLAFSAIAILNVEPPDQANIKDAGDALWWAITTITTVGYGDKYPVTLAGRVIAACLMFCGISLFGVFTAFVANLLLRSDDTSRADLAALTAEVRLLREELAHLRAPAAKPISVEPQTQSTTYAEPAQQS